MHNIEKDGKNQHTIEFKVFECENINTTTHTHTEKKGLI